MRVTLALGIGLIFIAAAACSSSSTSTANSCGSSGAAANIGATDAQVFSPNHATITHGQSVCWQNNGSILHTVTDNGGGFDTRLPAGQNFVLPYATAHALWGHCTIHH